MLMNEMLFYGGLALAGIAAVLGLAALLLFHLLDRQLAAKLDEEYGKRRR